MSDERKFNILVGVILGSYLSNEEKNELIKFVRDLEEYKKMYKDLCK